MLVRATRFGVIGAPCLVGDGVQPHEVDPLHFAVERGSQAGIVVVVSAGNDGNAAALRHPASDPYVIAVGATDSKNTARTTDDAVAEAIGVSGFSRPPAIGQCGAPASVNVTRGEWPDIER